MVCVSFSVGKALGLRALAFLLVIVRARKQRAGLELFWFRSGYAHLTIIGRNCWSKIGNDLWYTVLDLLSLSQVQ